MSADCYAQTPDGRLMIADGINPVRIWDGQTAEPELAGLMPPTSAVTMANGSGAGNIVGNYFAFSRFIDRRGNESDFGPISAQLVAQSATLTVTDATNTTPIAVTTSAPHALTTGDTVVIDEVLGNDEANGTWEVSVIDATSFYLIDSSAVNDYASGGTVRTGVDEINYTDVPLPAEAEEWASKVVRRQILRNTAGQATTFYIDIDTEDLVSTSFSSDQRDSVLSTNEAVPLLDENGGVFANAHGVPPRHKRCLAHHLGRMFFAVDGEYKRGAVAVTNASVTVRGINTKWVKWLKGFFLYVDGATASCEILSVDAAAQTLTLTEAYTDATQAYATYKIRPAPAERRLSYYAEANEPESVAATSTIELQEDGDDITGLLVNGSFIYFLEARHIYKLTFQSNPGIDGYVFQGAQRGCVNQRLYAEAEGTAYMLDQAGVHAFTGGDESEPSSMPIQRLFQSQAGGIKWINWKAAETFHAAIYPAEEVVRWFVCLSGFNAPRHALAYHHRSKSWWLEEFAAPITASCVGAMAGQRRVFLGGEGRRVSMLGVGRFDGIAAGDGTLHGDVTSADRLGITDAYASFSANVAGLSLAIVGGRGRDQRRKIRTVDGQRLVITTPWHITPDDTSKYQIAGITWRFHTRRWQFGRGEKLTNRRFAIFFRPTKAETLLDLQLFLDDAASPTVWQKSQEGQVAEGFAATAGKDTLQANLTRTNGHAQQRFDGQKDPNIDGPRSLRFQLSGTAGEDGVEISAMDVDGVVGAQ